jgi:hypothetical protein
MYIKTKLCYIVDNKMFFAVSKFNENSCDDNFKLATFPNQILTTKRPRSNTEVADDKRDPLMPEINPSTQRCLTRFFTGDFAS